MEWTFRGAKIKNSLATVLVIPDIKENDYGSYLCTAKSLKRAAGPFTITINKTEGKFFAFFDLM